MNSTAMPAVTAVFATRFRPAPLALAPRNLRVFRRGAPA
jgi:hypothetical protein